MPIKPYPELPSVLDDFVSGAQNLLSDNLLGVYLVGSLAVGGFDLDSDIDFLVVVNEEISDETARALQAMHARIYEQECYPAKHLEGSYISHDVLIRAETVNIQELWYLDNGSTVLERSTHCNKWHVRWMLRERGIRLLGPEPDSLLEPVPKQLIRKETAEMMYLVAGEFAEAIKGDLTFWTSRFGQSFAVITFCRMLHTLETGKVQSKQAGVKWGLNNLDTGWSDLIQEAWKEREGVRFCAKIRQRANLAALEKTNEFIQYAISKMPC
ncbi:MAG: DUF4111 domain-containing protein [candidate division Zixibacteria bacterium]|nr:DUF4111 domain-containing protein [candidate division Zixibacteria bacterium]